MDLINNLVLGFGTALTLPNLFYAFVGLHDRHADRRAARDRSHRDPGDAAADHLRARADVRADHAGRHLLRRAVRRIDHGDPGQPARRIVVGGHVPRRLPDGAPRPRRRGARDRGARLVLRRHGRHAGARGARGADGRARVQVRAGRVLLADGARPDRRRRARVGLAGQGDRHDRARPAARPGRHRRQLGRVALRVRHSGTRRRHRFRRRGDGRVRLRRDHRQPRARQREAPGVHRQGRFAAADLGRGQGGLGRRAARHRPGRGARRAARAAARCSPPSPRTRSRRSSAARTRTRRSARATSAASPRRSRPTMPARRPRSSRC